MIVLGLGGWETNKQPTSTNQRGWNYLKTRIIWECLAYGVVCRLWSLPLRDSGCFCLEVNTEHHTMEDAKIIKEVTFRFQPHHRSIYNWSMWGRQRFHWTELWPCHLLAFKFRQVFVCFVFSCPGAQVSQLCGVCFCVFSWYLGCDDLRQFY